MGPFIQGRMVLPFQLKRTESLFLSFSRGETLQLARLTNHSTIFTASLTAKEWQEKSSSLCTEHRELLTLRCSNFILQGPVQSISPLGSWPPQTQKIYAHRNWETLICTFAIPSNTVLWQVLQHCLVLYFFLFSPTFVHSITLYLLQRLRGSIPLTAG